MKLIIIFLSVISAGFASTVQGQTVLEGTIRDSLSGDVLAGVNVFFPELEKGTLTNSKGTFQVSHLASGIFRVQFRLLEYRTKIISINLQNDTVRLNINLSPIVVESHGIVVSSPFQSEQDENPIEVIQIEKAAIEKIGDPSLMGALATRPGISQISTGTNIGKPVIRGLSGNRVVVYSQGMRVENQQWGDEHGLGITDIGIDKVEILKGPSTLLYGSDAMGGVIHVMDERSAEIGTIQGDAGLSYYSNTAGVSSDLGIKGAGKLLRAGIRAGYKNHADYMSGGNYRVSYSRFNEAALKANVGLNLPWLVSSLRYTGTSSNIGIPDELEATRLERDMNITHQELQNHLFAFQNLILAGKSKIRINAGYLLNRRAEFEGERDSASGQINLSPGLNMGLSTFNYDLKWYSPKVKRLEVIAGMQGMFQTNRNQGEEALIPDANVTDAGILGVAKISWKKFQLQFGGRGDFRKLNSFERGIDSMDGYFAPLTRQFPSLNGAAGFVFNASGKFLIRFNGATGFRSPTLAELHSNGVHEGTLRYEIGDLNLKRERNIEADLGCHFHGEHIAFEVSLFNNYISDYIFISPQDSMVGDLKVFAYEQESANLNGGEAGLDIHPHPFDWLHIELTASLVNAKMANGNNLPFIPPIRFSGTLRGEFQKFGIFKNPWLTLNSIYVLAQNQNAVFEVKTPGYFLLNLSAGTKIGKGKNASEIMFAVNNLLNAAYYDHLSRLRRNNLYNIGRNVTVTARIPFEVKKN